MSQVGKIIDGPRRKVEVSKDIAQFITQRVHDFPDHFVEPTTLIVHNYDSMELDKPLYYKYDSYSSVRTLSDSTRALSCPTNVMYKVMIELVTEFTRESFIGEFEGATINVWDKTYIVKWARVSFDYNKVDEVTEHLIIDRPDIGVLASTDFNYVMNRGTRNGIMSMRGVYNNRKYLTLEHSVDKACDEVYAEVNSVSLSIVNVVGRGDSTNNVYWTVIGGLLREVPNITIDRAGVDKLGVWRFSDVDEYGSTTYLGVVEDLLYNPSNNVDSLVSLYNSSKDASKYGNISTHADSVNSDRALELEGIKHNNAVDKASSSVVETEAKSQAVVAKANYDIASSNAKGTSETYSNTTKVITAGLGFGTATAIAAKVLIGGAKLGPVGLTVVGSTGLLPIIAATAVVAGVVYLAKSVISAGASVISSIFRWVW